MSRLSIILFEPEIPPNTGNIIRLCANTGAKLHLIKPLGFKLEDKSLRRAGLDYHEWADLKTWDSLEECLAYIKPDNAYAMTTKGTRSFFDVQFGHNDALIFGPETRGLPKEYLESRPHETLCRLPMSPNGRSLNLSNSVAIAMYEAWRQLDFTSLS